MNSLSKIKKIKPTTATPMIAGSSPGLSQRLDADFNGQIGPVFPDELQDPDAARSLRIAFFLGVRLGASRVADSTNSIISTAASEFTQLNSARKAAASAEEPATV